MVAALHFPLPSPSSSPSTPPWFSLVCWLVVMSMSPPLVLSTLPLPQPLPINALPPLVRWRISFHLLLFAGCYRFASCRTVSALHRFSSHSRLSPRPSSTPPLCLHRLAVASHLVAPPPHLDVPPAHVLPLAAPLPYIRQLAFSRTAIFIARRRDRQRPMSPLVWLSSSNTSACAAASSSLQLNHPPSLPNSRHILEEGDEVEAFYVCVKKINLLYT